MKYILSPGVALRAFRGVDRCCFRGDSITAFPLSKDEFDRMLLCDGAGEIPDDERTEMLLRRELIRPAEEGEVIDPRQRFVKYNNRYVPFLYLQITGKCNYNCIHCFNAKDNDALNTEMSFSQIIPLLDQARDCGMRAVAITGGEPLAHRDFLQIADAVRERDLILSEVITNGSLLNDSVLDRLESGVRRPVIKISFDGIGYHDIMRRHAGAEQEALRAIRLCIGRGFPVRVQCNINRENSACISATLDMLDSMGVQSTRIIRTTEAPRVEHRSDLIMDFDEYFSAASKIVRVYAAVPRRMALSLWMFGNYDPSRDRFSYVHESVSYRDRLPLCTESRGRVSVAADGSIYPCIQCMGVFQRDGLSLGNVFTTPLREILGDSPFMTFNDRRVAERLEQPENKKCRDCEYWTRCKGGCPLLGYGFSETKNWLAADPMACRLFKGNYAGTDLLSIDD